MGQYTLNIIINRQGRKFFQKFNEKVILVRAIDSSSTYQIVCAAFSPFGRKTIITFNEDWRLAVTNDKLKPNTVIEYKDQINANLGQSYDYKTSGFVSGTGTVQPSNILVSNDRPEFTSLAFGLGQSIDIGDGQGPKYRSLSIGEYPFNQSFNFIPNNELWILPASGLSENMLLLTSSLMSSPENLKARSNTMGKYLAIKIGKTKTIHFDNKMHAFQKGPLPK